MLSYSRYPEDMFTGSPETLQNLREAIRRMQGQ
jgi:hypothetical protein